MKQLSVKTKIDPCRIKQVKIQALLETAKARKIINENIKDFMMKTEIGG